MPRKFADWLDERIDWRARRQTRAHPTMASRSPSSAAIAAAIATCFSVLFVTGTALMTVYAPSVQSAWASVHYVQYLMPGGWLVRGLHSWAAQGLIVLTIVHVAHGIWIGSYRKPRELVWWFSLVVVGLALGAGITGGLLPWDQRGWWARVVEGNIVGLAPVVGGWMQRLMLGGNELGALGLARAHTVHVVVLPLATVAVLWCRHALVARQGWTDSAPLTKPGIPAVALNACVLTVVVLSLTAITVATTPGIALDAPADSMSDYPARPEWFLLTLFELRKLFHGAAEFWGTSLLPLAAVLYLAALPWLDPLAPQVPSRRWIALAPVVVIFGSAMALGVFAWRKDARDPVYLRQRAHADARAISAVKAAMGGVPLAGALDMVRHDPELHGRDLFAQHCATCHVLGDLGDPKTATAPKLDGWGTPQWIAAMIHDPDAPDFFGRGPYAGEMPSVDVPPKQKQEGKSWSPMIKSETEKRAVAVFLASLGEEMSDPAHATQDGDRSMARKIITERCSTCHLYDGEGDDEGSGLAPELSGYGSLSWIKAQIADPANPKTYRELALDEKRKKHMPRFEADLSAADIAVVAAWTRARARGVPLR